MYCKQLKTSSPKRGWQTFDAKEKIYEFKSGIFKKIWEFLHKSTRRLMIQIIGMEKHFEIKRSTTENQRAGVLGNTENTFNLGQYFSL